MRQTDSKQTKALLSWTSVRRRHQYENVHTPDTLGRVSSRSLGRWHEYMITTSATARHDILGTARRRSRSPAPVLSVSVFAHPSTTLLLTSTLQRYVAISTEYLTIINYKQLLLLLLLLTIVHLTFIFLNILFICRQLRSSLTRAAVVTRTRTHFGKCAFSVCGPHR